MQAFAETAEIARDRTLSVEDSLYTTVTENYPLHQGAAPTRDRCVVGGTTESELPANIRPPSSLPASPHISGDMHGTSCNIRHHHVPQTLGQSASSPNQEFYFLSVIHDAGFLPTSAAFDVTAPSCSSMTLDPFYADWPHWDIPAAHPLHPPLARPVPLY
jgi:hypothetical protein